MPRPTAAAIVKCLAAMPGVTSGHPFGPQALVFKIAGRMFASLREGESPPRLTLKCAPELAHEYRRDYPAITGAYHMNKTHWISVLLDGSVPQALLFTMIDASYTLVRDALPKKLRQSVPG